MVITDRSGRLFLQREGCRNVPCLHKQRNSGQTREAGGGEGEDAKNGKFIIKIEMI